jgi:hypothetical protein
VFTLLYLYQKYLQYFLIITNILILEIFLSKFVAMATNLSRKEEKEKTCVISRQPSTHISGLLEIFSLLLLLSLDPVYVLN